MTTTPKYDRPAALAMQSYEVVFGDNDVALVTAEEHELALAMIVSMVARIDELGARGVPALVQTEAGELVAVTMVTDDDERHILRVLWERPALADDEPKPGEPT